MSARLLKDARRGTVRDVKGIPVLVYFFLLPAVRRVVGVSHWRWNVLGLRAVQRRDDFDRAARLESFWGGCEVSYRNMNEFYFGAGWLAGVLGTLFFIAWLKWIRERDEFRDKITPKTPPKNFTPGTFLKDGMTRVEREH